MKNTLVFMMDSGASGDMILGSLFALGLDFDLWNRTMVGLGVPFKASLTSIERHGINGKKISIVDPHLALHQAGDQHSHQHNDELHHEHEHKHGGAHHPHVHDDHHHHRSYTEIKTLIEKSHLPERAKNHAIQIFTRLGLAEAKIHNKTLDQIHFHEVGAVDSIVDIVGACVGLEMLGIDNLYSNEILLGPGQIKCAHGVIPLPAPATTELTQNYPVRWTQIEGEFTTPTGAAIITTLCTPNQNLSSQLTILNQGWGFGDRDWPELAPGLRALLVETSDSTHSIEDNFNKLRDTAIELSCTLDDHSPEVVAYTSQKLFELGCFDVWQTSYTGKKNRSGMVLSALFAPDLFSKVVQTITSELATGGLRYHNVERIVSQKEKVTLTSPWGALDFKKISFGSPLCTHLKPEYESCAKLAREKGLPLQVIMREAISMSKSSLS